MKRYNLLLVSAAFMIAIVGTAFGHQGNNALTAVYGKTSLNQCLLGNPSTLESGCSTAPAGIQCTVLIYSTLETAPAYNTRINGSCFQPLWYN